jgi:phosphatidylglycerophosphate synthase
MFSFQKFWSPVLIQIIYILGLIMIAVSAVLAIANSGRGGYGGYGYGAYATADPTLRMLMILLGSALLLLIWRVLCEAWIVLFSINDRLGVLVQRGEQQP